MRIVGEKYFYIAEVYLYEKASEIFPKLLDYATKDWYLSALAIVDLLVVIALYVAYRRSVKILRYFLPVYIVIHTLFYVYMNYQTALRFGLGFAHVLLFASYFIGASSYMIYDFAVQAKRSNSANIPGTC